MTGLGRRQVGRRTGLRALLGAVVLMTGAAAFASDSGVERRVQDRLARARLEERGEVRVSVKDGIVSLDGFTTTVAAKREAERAAGKESKRVESRLVARPVPVPDRALHAAVVDAILSEPRYGVFDSVAASVKDGVVVLQGSVYRGWLKDAFDRRVARLDGVREIRNEIRIAPASIHDDRLRVQLYRRIYGDELFVPYASWPNPPIRIVVENGNVTLTGVVRSKVEQAKLGSIARGTLAFRVVNAVEVESERPKEPGAKTMEG